MKFPKEFNIKGEQWVIKKVASPNVDGEETLGTAEMETRIIEISRKLQGKQKEQILLHEFIHACIFELHVDLEEGVEETLADGLAKCFLDNFHMRPR